MSQDFDVKTADVVKKKKKKTAMVNVMMGVVAVFLYSRSLF